jgi:hypothetical protein
VHCFNCFSYLKFCARHTKGGYFAHVGDTYMTDEIIISSLGLSDSGKDYETKLTNRLSTVKRHLRIDLFSSVSTSEVM